jgi:CD109 antigen
VGGQVETTALAALGMVQGRRHSGTAGKALAWLVSKKDPNGTWYSTQATVLALKALVAGTKAPKEEKERHIVLRLGDKYEKEIRIPAKDADVMQQIDLSSLLVPGGQRLTLSEKTGTAAGYQVMFRYHVPEEPKPAAQEPLAVQLKYDSNKVAVNGVIKATAQVSNRMAQPAAMVMVDLPVPPGFTPLTEDFAALVGKPNGIARFQVTPRQVIVYLTGLPAGAPKPLELNYRLRATTPVKVRAPGARAYEYYAPERQGQSAGTELTVTALP